jgi:hypothetical protein
MPKQWVIMMVPSAKKATVNPYLVGLFGDDPGTDLLPLNAYLDGQADDVGTHCVIRTASPQSEADQLVAFFTHPDQAGCGIYTEELQQGVPGPMVWAYAEATWDLLPVVA